MPSPRCVLFVAGLMLAGAGRVHAQQMQPPPAAAAMHLEFPQAAPVAPLGPGLAAPDRTRHALLGGAIGAAAGVVACTVISTLADDSADGGISFCPLDSYLLIGGAGFIVGAVIGWVL